MVTTPRFQHVVSTEAELRAAIGEPKQMVKDKVIGALDAHCRQFIAKSPFLIVASSDAAGRQDVSPKGDAAGFVTVLDDHTFVIPERLGNKLAFTFRNILANPHVGVLFLVPGNGETLRVNGRAQIVRDPELMERMAVRGKAPQFGLVVTAEEVFLHCAKCIIRSDLWNPESWPDLTGFPTYAETIKAQRHPRESVEEIQRILDDSYETELY